MNIITFLKSYLQDLQDRTDGINYNRMVIDQSQLTKYLDSHHSSQNNILIGVVPDVGSDASNSDYFQNTVIMQLMVLEKTSYSMHDYDSYFSIFENAYNQIQQIQNHLLQDSLSGCNELRFLNANTINIKPVWNLSSCNGFKILFNLDVSL